ncbi:MAG TPA: hypothetical protein VF980_15805 [Thermoanaerobaculia bacterium]
MKRVLFSVASVLLALSCHTENNASSYSTWHEAVARKAGVFFDAPDDATVHDFDVGVVVFLHPVFKPVWADWQYAIEIKIERLSRTAFDARVSTDNLQPRWMSAEHRRLDTNVDGDVTYYRLDKSCSALEVLTAVARLDQSRRKVPADAGSRDDYAIRRILNSAKCGSREAANARPLG